MQFVLGSLMKMSNKHEEEDLLLYS